MAINTIRELRKTKDSFMFKLPGGKKKFFICQNDEKTDMIVDSDTGEKSTIEIFSPFYDTNVELC